MIRMRSFVNRTSCLLLLAALPTVACGDMTRPSILAGSISRIDNPKGLTLKFTPQSGGRFIFVGSIRIEVFPDQREAAEILGVDHFNWMQRVVRDSSPPPTENHVTPTVPYIDPPLDGWLHEKYWDDHKPFYLNEVDMARTRLDSVADFTSFGAFDFANIPYDGKSMLFIDNPSVSSSSNVLEFETWLVGVSETGQPVSLPDTSVIRWLYDQDGVFGTDFRSNIENATPGGTTTILQTIDIRTYIANNQQFFSQYGFDNSRLSISAVPEPTSLIMAGIGLAGVGMLARKRRG